MSFPASSLHRAVDADLDRATLGGVASNFFSRRSRMIFDMSDKLSFY